MLTLTKKFCDGFDLNVSLNGAIFMKMVFTIIGNPGLVSTGYVGHCSRKLKGKCRLKCLYINVTSHEVRFLRCPLFKKSCPFCVTALFHSYNSSILLSTQTILFYYYHMYGTFTYPEFFCSLPHRRLMFNNIICDLYCPFLNIIFHTKPLHSLFLQCMQGL